MVREAMEAAVEGMDAVVLMLTMQESKYLISFHKSSPSIVMMHWVK